MSDNQMTLVGSIPRGSGRRPASFQAGRVCADADCSTQLSRYNRFDKCSVHQKTRYPRVRGVPADKRPA